MPAPVARSGRFSTVLLCPLLLVLGCVGMHPTDEPPPEVLRAEQLKASSTKPGDKTTGEPGVAEASGPNTDEQLAFIHRRSPANAPFNEADRAFVNQLPSSPAPGSVAEAALALGLVKTVLHPLNTEASTFHEETLGGRKDGNEAAPNKLLSLEQLCRDHGLNLPDALSENPLLGSAAIAQQTMAALQLGQNSEEFNTEITLALRKRAAEWNQVSGTMPQAPATTTTPPAPGAPVGPPAVAGPPSPAPAPAANGDIPMLVPLAVQAGGDTSLTEAQALADRGDFQAAIQHASSIPESSPLHAEAQEKVKEFSNLGVQDLRRKAAAAFQTAMPVSDPKTKSEYLKQAKAYLEEAIKSYPAASQIPTVRENLRVISKDLERISG